MRKSLLVVLAMVALTGFTGCVGKNYIAEPKTLDNGYTVIQGGRTGAFGTDNSFVYIAPPQVPVEPVSTPEPKIVELKTVYTKSSTSWDNCKDATPNKNAKNVKREEVEEKWVRERIVQSPISEAPIQPQAAFWAGGNASTGNLALPAAFIASGMVGNGAATRPDRTNIHQSGGGASSSSSATGGAGGNSNSEAASASSSASNAEQSQNQGQSLDNSTDVDIDID